MIFDLVLWEGDQALNKSHAWKRGLQLLETLYKYAKRLGRRNDLPTQAILMSGTFGVGREDTPEFRQFDLAKRSVADDFAIAIEFFHRGNLSQPSTDQGMARSRFGEKIRSAIASRGSDSQT